MRKQRRQPQEIVAQHKRFLGGACIKEASSLRPHQLFLLVGGLIVASNSRSPRSSRAARHHTHSALVEGAQLWCCMGTHQSTSIQNGASFASKQSIWIWGFPRARVQLDHKVKASSVIRADLWFREADGDGGQATPRERGRARCCYQRSYN